MAKMIGKPDWREFLKNFSSRHEGERTRLGVFEIHDGVVNDLWIEDGAPLVGIDIDTKDGKRTIGIALEHFRHSIENVTTITQINGETVEGGLDIRDDEGKTTILRFEESEVETEE